MKTILAGRRSRIILSLVGLCLLLITAWFTLEERTQAGPETGRLEKMIVASGSAAMDMDLGRLTGSGSGKQNTTLRFAAVPDSFFKILVFNDELRGALPGSMDLVSQNSASPSAGLPTKLTESIGQLVIESSQPNDAFELVIRDGKTGFVFFNIEGHQYDYDAKDQSLNLQGGRLLVSNEFATELGRPSQAGSVVGAISIAAAMRSIETTAMVNGEAKTSVLPPNPEAGTVPGPDVIVGELVGLQQFGSSGSQVGLAVGTDSCNAGVVPLNWFALPNNDHPVIPQNLYRLSGGATNNERFEQIGQSSLKHAFTALQQNACGFGCQSSGTGTLLGSGCSDPYSASLNASQSSLGSRAWVNPFTGAFPSGGPSGQHTANNHTGHSHTGASHRILTNVADLNTTLNPGASYYAEAQYVTPHEYAWCQANPGQCNMYNNASYKPYNVTGTTSFSFSSAGPTVRTKPAIYAWPGATLNEIRPDPANDGIGIVGYKVTNPSAGVYHYEYALYNQNLDRAIQSFSIPVWPGVALTNVGFHSPPQHPASAADGTFGSTGYSSTPWAQTQNGGVMTWSSETFAQNQNANAVRWGTMYNIRFDSSRPPIAVNATIGFLKTGAPVTVQVLVPSPNSGPRPCYERQPQSERCTPAQ